MGEVRLVFIVGTLGSSSLLLSSDSGPSPILAHVTLTNPPQAHSVDSDFGEDELKYNRTMG
jgi:hypothetical protein